MSPTPLSSFDNISVLLGGHVHCDFNILECIVLLCMFIAALQISSKMLLQLVYAPSCIQSCVNSVSVVGDSVCLAWS